jgi:hypothetical protein
MLETTSKKGTDKMPDEDLYPCTPPASEAQPLPGANCIILEVESGQIVIIGDFNLFRLDEHDRELVAALSDAARKHRQAKPQPPIDPRSFAEAKRDWKKVLDEMTSEDLKEITHELEGTKDA